MGWANSIVKSGLVGLAIIVIGAASAPRAQAALITFQYKGKITPAGYDYAGAWGAPNSSLAGRPVSVVFNVDTSLGTYVSFFQSQTSTEYRYGDDITPGPVLSSSMTIGSTAVSWVPNYFNRIFAERIVPNLVNTWPDGYSDMGQISNSHNGNYWAQLMTVVAMGNASLPFGVDALGSGLLDPQSLIGADGYASAWHYDDPAGPRIEDWNANFKIASYSVRAAAAPIPEPYSLSLLGAGLFGVAGFRLRNRKK